MALTLLEASKGDDNLFRRGLIETFVAGSPLLQRIPFRDIEGSADGVVQEAALPEAESRGVNEAFTESEGRVEEIIQSLKIYGGDIGIDPFILATKGQAQAARQVDMKVKAVQNKWMLDFFKGDAGADPRDFDGLQLRLTAGNFNVVDAGATSGGDALDLQVLDEAIARCHAPSALAMGRTMWTRFNQAARDQNVGGVLERSRNEFGQVVLSYGPLDILMVTDAANADNILPFTEAAPVGGQLQTSSVYVLGFGDEGVEGIQNGGFQVRDLGEDNSTPKENTRVEWYNNFHINHPRSVIRVRGISNAAFV